MNTTVTEITTYEWFDLFHWFPKTEIVIETRTENGHLWVIDDYMLTLTCDGKMIRPVYLVHCNLGWGGRKNGWYVDGIFDAREGTMIDDGPRREPPGILFSKSTIGTERVYKYNIRIIPFLKPNRN
ncbi:MAG: C10 family peptidase [Spirochaetaceae bacterium]|jgi:hypothetical protein|nr:C10 family peptidase [Spirochaetaceae bacterium]